MRARLNRRGIAKAEPGVSGKGARAPQGNPVDPSGDAGARRMAGRNVDSGICTEEPGLDRENNCG